MPKILVVTGGGSGGHTSAASAVIRCLQDANSPLEIYWITSHHGIEARVAHRLGVTSRRIAAGKLHRSLNSHTFPDLIKVPLGIVESWSILGKIHPGVVFSTGGYVSVPVVVAAALRRIPIVIHEQTVDVGLANKLSSLFAQRILVSYKESIKYFDSTKCAITGPPVRPEVFQGSRDQALQLFDFDSQLKTIYVTGGAQGASTINRAVGETLPVLLEHFQIIHQCGTISTDYGREWLDRKKSELPKELRQRYQLLEYIDEDSIGSVFSIADLVISRSGAAITAEIDALDKICILIPYPYSIGNEQVLHANMLERRGLAHVIADSDLRPHILATAIFDALGANYKSHSSATKSRSGEKMRSAQLIVEEIMRAFGNNCDQDQQKNELPKGNLTQEGICPNCKQKAQIMIIDDTEEGIAWGQCSKCGHMYHCG